MVKKVQRKKAFTVELGKNARKQTDEEKKLSKRLVELAEEESRYRKELLEKLEGNLSNKVGRESDSKVLNGIVSSLDKVLGIFNEAEAKGIDIENLYVIEEGGGCKGKKRIIKPLSASIDNGLNDFARIISNYDSDLDKKDKRELYSAIKIEKENIFELLKANRADIFSPNKNGYSSIHSASQDNRIDILNILLPLYDSNKSVDFPAANNGETPLVIASQNGNIETMQLLLKFGADVNRICISKDGQGVKYTALYVAAENDKPEAVRLLIDNNADVNLLITNSNHWHTPLHIASFLGHIEVVKLLLDNGASPNLKTAKNYTSLSLALLKNQKSVIKEFLKKLGAFAFWENIRSSLYKRDEIEQKEIVTNAVDVCTEYYSDPLDVARNLNLDHEPDFVVVLNSLSRIINDQRLFPNSRNFFLSEQKKFAHKVLKILNILKSISEESIAKLPGVNYFLKNLMDVVSENQGLFTMKVYFLTEQHYSNPELVKRIQKRAEIKIEEKKQKASAIIEKSIQSPYILQKPKDDSGKVILLNEMENKLDSRISPFGSRTFFPDDKDEEINKKEKNEKGVIGFIKSAFEKAQSGFFIGVSLWSVYDQLARGAGGDEKKLALLDLFLPIIIQMLRGESEIFYIPIPKHNEYPDDPDDFGGGDSVEENSKEIDENNFDSLPFFSDKGNYTNFSA